MIHKVTVYGVVNLIHVVKDMVQWLPLFITILELWVSQNARNYVLDDMRDYKLLKMDSAP
jgi:hypothetical protein